jgi:cytochrome d ubiquinol oxidase subunit I
MIASALFAAFLWWRGTLFETRWFLRILSLSWWTGFVAVIAGWVVTESGRQPWLVYGIQRTADAVSPVPAASILGTLALFVFAYGIVFSMGIYYINRLIVKGPQERAAGESQGVPNRPLTGADADAIAGGR